MKEKNISQVIRDRIKNHSSQPRFFANDNIAEFIHEGELDLLVDEVAEKFQGVLNSLVIDTDNDHNTQDTARRVAKMFIAVSGIEATILSNEFAPRFILFSMLSQ